MSDSFAEEIARGIELLDAHSPMGVSWPYAVDLSQLDMSDWSRCVVGQLYGGGFTFGLEELMRAERTHAGVSTFATMHGFDISPLTRTMSMVDYVQLGREWISVIKRLRVERSTSLTGV
jgi:hypothetical protein